MNKLRNIFLRKHNSRVYSDVNGLSLQNLFYVKNGYFPHCHMFANSGEENDFRFETEGLIEEINKRYAPKKWWEKLCWWKQPRCVFYRTYSFTEKTLYVGINIILYKENIFARIEENVNESYVLYGNEKEGSHNVSDFINLVTSFYKPPKKDANNLFLVAQDNTGYHLNKYTIKPPKEFDIAKQYNDDFGKQDEIINNFLCNNERSGIVILHGEKGTGKTTYIRNIINKHPELKFVFVPSNMISLLGEPSFGNFLMTLKNNIIILEDCEDVIRTRKSNSISSSAVSLLLNMGDGLLSDGLGIKFICTFNENISNIDEALLRKGRLACKYEFKELSVEKSNALLEELYGDRECIPTTTKPMTLADIYNIDAQSYENIKKTII